MNKILQGIAWFFIIAGAAITVFYLIGLNNNGWYSIGKGTIDIEKSGQFGDYVGGFVGTIFSVSGFIFLYITFKEQRLAFQRERFESNFFELIKMHRDNVNELKYLKPTGKHKDLSEGRKVIKEIFKEFLFCLKEVRAFSNSKNPDDYIKPKYKKVLKKITGPINQEIDLYQLATIDIAFCIVFFGLGEEGEIILRKLFLRKYTEPYFQKVLFYMQLKPTRKYSSEFAKWNKLKSLDTEVRYLIIAELYEKRRSDLMESYSSEVLEYRINRKYIKYYGGHQHRLGHYFRHLFQCYKFLNSQAHLSENEKYFYGKTLRAQLSTYEQALLFIDSISSLGFKWEYTPDYKTNPSLSDQKNEELRNDQRLITKYNLVKNLPSDKFLDILYKNFYPKVDYESDEIHMTKLE